MKINTMSVFLMSIFAAISLSLLSLNSSIEEQVLLDRISRGDYSKEAIHFSIDGTKSIKDIINFIEKSGSNGIAIIKDNYEDNIRQIYIKGQYDAPPMFSGRYFDTEDFYGEKKLAVVGKNRLKDVTDRNGEQWIVIKNEEFRVIGVMGYRVDTTLDEKIVVNSSYTDDTAQRKTFILDISSKSKKDVIENIFSEIEKSDKSIKKLDIDYSNIGRLIKNISSNIAIYMLSILCYVTCSIAISLEWINKQRRKIAVMRLVGRDNIGLSKEIYIKYLGFSLIGMILGLVAFQVLGLGSVNFRSFLSSMIANMIIGIVTTIPPIKSMLKVSVAEVMR